MRTTRHAMALAAWIACAAASADAQVLRDPAVPEALRRTHPAPPTTGEALRALVQAKLEARFQAADAGGQGHITRAQAEVAGWGYVVKHFDAIDSAGHGSVSWAQVQAYLAQRQRQLSRPSTSP